MSYQCNDCSYSKKAPFPGGKCPACGSFNIHREGDEHQRDQPGGKRWRLLLSLGLWALLGYLVYQKL